MDTRIVTEFIRNHGEEFFRYRAHRLGGDMCHKLMLSILAVKSGASYQWVQEDTDLERVLLDLLPMRLGLVVFARGKAAMVIREKQVDIVNPSADPVVQARAELALAGAGAEDFGVGYLPGPFFPTILLALRHWRRAYRTETEHLSGLREAAKAALRGYARWSAEYVDPELVDDVKRAWEERV